ncbi:hypothetical protein SynBIOSE41_02802 [Synechococcus sp. BIOS-E4-1]|nr:hypothetical protein SynBIOSE41_02802 [Synechococcus sp. BIOS-E4-1]
MRSDEGFRGSLGLLRPPQLQQQIFAEVQESSRLRWLLCGKILNSGAL